MMYAVKQISEYVVRGRGVVFGGKDLTGDRFTAQTDFGDTRSFVGMPVYYDHGLSNLQSQIGTVKMWQPDDEGIDVEIEIDKRHKYAQQVMALVKRGVLGLSTGALSHLVVRDGGELKRWIVGEISLTPTPAEPRTMAISDTKAVPQAGNSDPASNSSNIHKFTTKELPTMSDQLIKDAVKAAIEEMAGEPVRGGVIAGNAPAAKKLTTMGNSNDQMAALKHWMRTGDEIAAKATLIEGTNANGGFLVPEAYAQQIIDKRDETWIGAKLPMQRYTTTSDVFNIAAQNEKSDFAFVAESGSYNQDEPTFSGVAITLYTASLGMLISNQLLRDQAMDLDGFIAREVGRAYARHLNNFMIVGTGSSQPYGIVPRATANTEALASTTGVDAADIINMVHKLPAAYADDTNSVGWVMRNTTLGAIRALTGNFFSFQATPQGGIDNLYGKPVAVSDKIAAMAASAKSILFGNFSYYAYVENLNLEISRNPYLYQANYQTAIFCTARWGGDVTQADAFVLGSNPAS